MEPRFVPGVYRDFSGALRTGARRNECTDALNPSAARLRQNLMYCQTKNDCSPEVLFGSEYAYAEHF